ncbi:MAG TPA: O-antigen ligase family protein [Micromonosporaceae bacterium]
MITRRLLDAAARVVDPPQRVKVYLIYGLALPQLYFLPKGSSDVSLWTLVTLFLAPGIVISCWSGSGRQLLRTGLVRVLLALIAVRVVAWLVWSPDRSAGQQPIALLVEFVVVVLLMLTVVRQDRDVFGRLQRVYWPAVVVEAALVVVFRLLPGVENAFLHTVGGVVIGQNTIAGLFGTQPNNVLDVAKSGGVFVNANVAAMFLGVSGLAALAVWSVTRDSRVRLVGIGALVAVLFTGSKSAILLAFLLPCLVFAAYYATRVARPAVRRGLLVGAAVLGVAGIVVLTTVDVGFVRALRHAFFERTEIWAYGGQAFVHHAVLGLGYGGWQSGFARYAAEHHIPRFPPHNMFLAAWAKTGLAGLALTAAFYVLLFRLVGRRLARTTGRRTWFVLYAGAALAWTLIQGMGENTDIFGDIHLIPVVALLIACLIVPPDEETGDLAFPFADRRDRQAPAVPAFRNVHPQPGVGTADVHAAVRG